MPFVCQAAAPRRILALLALALSAGLALSATPAAHAAYTAIDPTQLHASLGVSGVVTGVSPTGEGLVIFRNGGNQLPFDLGAVSRTPGGVFSGVQELSTTANTESPTRIPFNAAGDTLVSWGIATNGAFGQFNTRPAGGIFATTDSFGFLAGNPGCGRFSDAAFGPDGTLLLACSTTTGAAPPNNQTVLITTRAPGVTGFAGASNVFPLTDDVFQQPRVAIGAEGTRAVALSQNPSAADPTIRVFVDPAGPTGGAVTTIAGPGQVNLSDVAVLSDGTVIVLYTDAGGVQARIRPAGDATVFGAPELVDAQGRFAEIEPDGAGAALLLIARQAVVDGPVTTLVASRSAAGVLSSPVELETATDVGSGSLQTAAGGLAVIKRQRFAGDAGSPSPQLAAWVRTTPGGTFSGPHVIADPARSGSLSISPTGDILAAWSVEVATADQRLLAGGLDSGSPPAIGEVQAPETALAGESASFSASASDWSGIREVRWTFGDGATATGERAAHAFAAPGTYEVTVRATDRGGNASEQKRTVRVVAAADPATANPDRTAPLLTVLTKTRLTRAQFRNGVSVRISANERTTVLAELLARAKGAKISAVPFNLVLGSRTGRNVQNSVTLRIKPNRTLVGKARSFSIRLRLTAEDAAGNRRVTGKTIKVAG